MAKFCEFCGKDISEIGQCDCAAAQQARNPQPAASAAQSAAAVAFNNGAAVMLGYLKTFFQSPVSTMRAAASAEGFIPGAMLLVVKALFFFLSSLIIGIPFGYSCLMMLLSLVLDAAFIGLYSVTAKLFKGNCCIKCLTGSMGVASIITSVGILLSSLMMLLNGTIGLATLTTVLIAGVLFSGKAFALTANVSEDKRFYAIMIVNFVVLLVSLLIASNFVAELLWSIMLSSFGW